MTLRRATAGLVILLLVAYFGAAFMMARGAISSERRPLEAHPSDFGLAFEEVEFPPRDNDLTLRGWYLPGQVDGPAVIVVHGLDSQRTANGALDLANRLVLAGFDVLLFDLRGHGTSGGDRVSGGYHEREDVLGAYDYLLTRGAVPGQVGVLGFSMGGGIAIMAAALEPGIAALVADSPFAAARDLIADETARRTSFPRVAVPVFVPAAELIARLVYGIDIGALRPERDVRDIEYPVLIIHGTGDDRISVTHGERIYGNAPPGSELWTPSSTGHVRAFLELPEEYTRRVVAYLEERLR